MKKRISFLIAVVMVLSMLPAMSVSAASENKMLVEGGTVADDYSWGENLVDDNGDGTGIVPPIISIKNEDPSNNWNGRIFSLSLTNAKWAIDDYAGAEMGATLIPTGSTSYAWDGNATTGMFWGKGQNASNANDLYKTATAVQFTVSRINDRLAQVEFDNDPGAAEILIPLLVKMDGEGDARVEISGGGTFGLSSGSYRIAKGAAGATTTTIEDSKKTFSNWLTIPAITIAENRVGSIKDDTDSVITLTAPNGFEWVDPTAPKGTGPDPFTGTGYFGFKGFNGGSPVTAGTGFQWKTSASGREDKGVLEFLYETNGFTKSISSQGTFVLENLQIVRSESASQTPSGDVRVRINIPGGTTEYVIVGVFGGRNVSLTVADKALPEISTGAYYAEAQDDKAECLEVTLTESSPNTWNEKADTVFTLSEGAKFRAVEITDTSGFNSGSTVIAVDDYITVNNEEDYEFDYSNTAAGTEAGCGVNLTATKLTFNPDDRDGSKTLEITFKVWVTVQPGAAGDVSLVTHEDNEAFGGDLSGVIAKAVEPVTVTASQNDVNLGFMNIPLSDIIIKENFAGALEYVGTTNYFAHNLFGDSEAGDIGDDDAEYWLNIGGYTGIWSNNRTLGLFKGAGEYEVVSGDLLIEEYDTREGNIYIQIKRPSSIPSEIKLSGMTMDADRTIPEGKLKLRLGGLATANYRNELTGKPDAGTGNPVSATPENYKDLASFDTQWIDVNEAYVNILDAAPSKDAKYTTEVEVTIGSNVIIANGKETQMDVAPFIQDGYTMVPVRAVAIALGLSNDQINWNPTSKTVTILDTNRGRQSQFTVGSNSVNLNGMLVPFEGPSCLMKDNRTFLPFRALGEIVLGCPVDWDDASRTAFFNKAN